MGNLVLNGATSGSTTVQPTDAVTAVITLPSTSGTLSVSGGSPSFATLTVTGDASISGLTVGKGGGAQSQNTAFGSSALTTNSTGNGNTANGFQSLYYNTASNNTAYGWQSNFNNSSGTGNTSVGYAALNQSTTASNLTAVGYQALYNNTGTENDAFGYKALFANTTGVKNAAFGGGALLSNTTGGSNVAMGREALISNTTGSNNVSIGWDSLYSNTTASNNTAVGYQAGYNTTGNACTYVGTSAGTTTTSGTNITCIGYATNPAAATDTNELVIGTGTTTGKGSNTGFFNNNFGGTYQGNNSASWSTTSDQRLKKNIVDNKTGLEAITKIQVRNFEYRTADEVTDLPKSQAIDIKGVQLGAIAQEIQAILPECVKTESTGVMSVDTTNLTWYLINAVKELKATVDAQAARIAVLEGAK